MVHQRVAIQNEEIKLLHRLLITSQTPRESTIKRLATINHNRPTHQLTTLYAGYLVSPGATSTITAALVFRLNQLKPPCPNNLPKILLPFLCHCRRTNFTFPIGVRQTRHGGDTAYTSVL
jgi:hypothetical protein